MKLLSYIKRYRYEILGSLFCLTLGILSGRISKAGISLWYINLNKPYFTPPAWVFGPVWTILYLMMGTAFGKVWKKKEKNKSLLTLFIIQLVLNLLWSPLFFYLQRIDLALIDVSMLLLCLIIFMIFAWHQRTVFLLFLPYVIWVSFALILNISIYTMNTARI